MSGTKWNGNAITHLRYLDAPIVAMALFRGKVAIATKTSLYLMGGEPYPGEADDPAVTADTSKAPAWLGEPEALMTHGTAAEGDDFVFLCSYRGRLYSWLGGRVAELDTRGDQGTWRRVGPQGTHCYGAAVAGDWLVVAIEGRYGAGSELWGFNGDGWWLLVSEAGRTRVWPCALGGAGTWDLVEFWSGSDDYGLDRLAWRTVALHTYGAAGTWTSSLLDGGDATRDKRWLAMGASFAAPAERGNVAATWTPAVLGAAVVKAWFTADGIGGIEGEPIAQWSDVSGNGRHATQGTAGDRPLYRAERLNGLPGVEFVSADWLGTSLSASSLDETVLATIDLDSAAGTPSMLGPSASGGRVLRVNPSRQLELVKSGVALIGAGTATITLDADTIVSSTLGVTTWELGIDGTVQSGTHAQTLAGGLTSSIGSDVAGAVPWDGDLHEIVVCTGLSAGDRQKVEGYLAHKWGLTGNLPGGHPYKTVAPVAPAPDNVTIGLEYSLDGGVSWTAAATQSVASATTRTFTLGSGFGTAPASRYVQTRVKWSSVSDWAPVLTGVWVESEAVHTPARRRKWELTVDAGDRVVRRDGQVDAQSGRQKVTALWDAWELGTAVSYQDVDNDTEGVTYTVVIEEIEEKVGKASDAGRWGESQVGLTLAEV